MKLKDVEVGLRVQMKSTDNHVPVGSMGAIACVQDSLVWVHWDNNVGGWGDEEYSIPDGYGWAVDISDLRKVKE